MGSRIACLYVPALPLQALLRAVPELRGAPVGSGPYRVRVGLGAPVLRDYYDVELEEGTLLRLYQDLASASWCIEAVYD